jgi:hypothetical protein
MNVISVRSPSSRFSHSSAANLRKAGDTPSPPPPPKQKIPPSLRPGARKGTRQSDREAGVEIPASSLSSYLPVRRER